MTLTVEDGTGRSGADSYVSVDDCNVYANARGLTFGTGTPAEAALRRATFYIDQTYSGRFQGTPTYGRAQMLEWPRTGASVTASSNDDRAYPIGFTEIPRELKQAVCEAAIREFAEPMSLSPDVEPGIKSFKAGSVSIDFAGSDASGSIFVTVAQAISKLLTPMSMFGGRVSRG